MVYISKLEIAGFKSFGFKNTVIHLKQGLISILGPNGSGKSNILDAIIFALGENKPKMMRVDKLSSLIHDVNKNKHGIRIARARIHFDNSDRKIPLESNIVTSTRELDINGESTYYINNKKITRTKFLDLLDVANLSLTQLNAIQQGTITRISEFSSDEKRIAIEDLIGLSYFDDKKEHALKQLEEADQKLEISLVRMNEIKKRINELEAEMNLKNRYEFLEQEINKFNSIKMANKLKHIQNVITDNKKSKQIILEKKSNLEVKYQKLKTQINNIKTEKSKLMMNIKNYNVEKKSIDNELQNTIQKFEKINSEIIFDTKQLKTIDNKLPDTINQISQLHIEKKHLHNKMKITSGSIRKIRIEKKKFENKIQNTNSQISNLINRQNLLNNKKISSDNQTKELDDKANKINLQLTKVELNYKFIENKLIADNKKKLNILKQIDRLKSLQKRLNLITSSHRKKVEQIKLNIKNNQAKYIELKNKLIDLTSIIKLSNTIMSKYETRINVLKKILHEDYTFAKLTEKKLDRSKIVGIVKDLFHWDPKYERAVLATCSNWMKIVVVRDFKTLLDISKTIYSENLPRLQIIPLDCINKQNKLTLPKVQIVGILDEFVKCDFKLNNLKKFLFGKFIITHTQEDALELSRNGYKAVTMNGEYFNNGKIAIIDGNSKLFNLEKIITIGSSTSTLNKYILTLQKLISNLESNMNNVSNFIIKNQKQLSNYQLGLSNMTTYYIDLLPKINNLSNTVSNIDKNLFALTIEKNNIAFQIRKLILEIDKLKMEAQQIQKLDVELAYDDVKVSLNKITKYKSHLTTQQNNLSDEYSKKTLHLANIISAFKTTASKIIILENEKNSLVCNKSSYLARISELKNQKYKTQQVLICLRQNEQNIISSSSSFFSKITEFDNYLSNFIKDEQLILRQINKLERKIDSLDRDIFELQKIGNKLSVNLLKYQSHYNEVELFDVEPIINQLNLEKNLLQINAKATDSYVEISQGYRSMSNRKNELEKERNSIVQFIESIEKEKRQTFLHAFDIVDKEIKLIFSKMTSGFAWLELQNEDNIFSSGVSYLVQFPNKPKRDTASISGGEKTLAAIVFILALQKLKSSSFYLFDEIDAHLDAPNSKQLSHIIKERSCGSQFIMVSLKDSLIEKANLIYGVYPKDGTSQVVVYKKPTIAK